MDVDSILEIVRNTVYSAVLLIALVYSCLILLISRFRHQNNMFILNLCLNTITTSVYFIIYFYAIDYDMPQSMCILFNYAFNIASIQIPFAFVAFTVHRFCVVVYHRKALFKTKRWVVVCILTQWIAQFIISLPFVFEYYDDCTSNTVWMGIYTLIIAVILPSLITMVLNICIFIHVRKSSLRVQAQQPSGITSGTNHQQSIISRRDISLLKQMILTFTMFVIGWTPALVINTIDIIIFVDFIIQMASVYLSVICLLVFMINLFICNHEIRRYVFDSIRRCFHC
ncbi:unnamed protein product [Adineta steineri]|uniref:G-protein coupled receptors family 1 profile domain-containing protein n=1 Tax=Adineta steineri TaxID=433720 RepID=A0A816BS15_9BILA|nr:unnamed protein product [Adineta steineri]CAF1611225.1 unnamed protein product [Adineta steineri]